MTALHQLGRRVVLDLSQVTFVGSDAVEFIRTAQQKGTRLTAVSPLLGTYFRTGEP
jgi:anti-anti-sigma regulatory factor